MTATRSERRTPGRATRQIAAVTVGMALLLTMAGQDIVRPVFAATSACPQGSTLDVVAHQDDDLLFLSPDLLHDVQTGLCVRTVFMTAGDAGGDETYWASRQSGSMAAYATMAGEADSWTVSDAGVPGHPMPLLTLNGQPRVSLVFMHLPDGNFDGTGFVTYGFESLEKLWTNQINDIATVDSSSSYTKDDLISTLVDLMDDYQPDTIRTQDEAGTFGDGDHSDHHAVAYFAEAAHNRVNFAHNFISYADYKIFSMPQNVTGADLTGKQDAFFAYARFDDNVCGSVVTCQGNSYGDWLERQYVVDVQSDGANRAPLANAGPDQSVVAGALVQLDGSASSDPDGDVLSYAWSQTAGPTVSLSSATADRPTFSTPSATASLTFSLTVSDGQLASSPDTVSISVAPAPTPTPSGTNVALLASASASSQDTSTTQTAAKAIDGSAAGSPGDYTREWATVAGGAGSWLQLTWSSPVTISRVVLYDRPNLDDQITAATLQFSDGSSVAVGALTNNGDPVTVTFAARTVTSLRLLITSVSASTLNAGLAEIEVYGL